VGVGLLSGLLVSQLLGCSMPGRGAGWSTRLIGDRGDWGLLEIPRRQSDGCINHAYLCPHLLIGLPMLCPQIGGAVFSFFFFYPVRCRKGRFLQARMSRAPVSPNLFLVPYRSPSSTREWAASTRPLRVPTIQYILSMPPRSRDRPPYTPVRAPELAPPARQAHHGNCRSVGQSFLDDDPGLIRISC